MRPNSSSRTPSLSLLLSPISPSPSSTAAIQSQKLPMYPSTTTRIHAIPLPLRGISVQPHLPAIAAARRNAAALSPPAAALRSFSSLLHPDLRSAAAVARRGGAAPAQRFVTCAAAAAAEAFVKKTALEHDVVIFSKTYCPYCSRAKSVFKELNKVPFVVELDTRDDGQDIQDALVKMVGRRTVPQVFIKGKHLGGSDDTVEAYESGKLVELLGN